MIGLCSWYGYLRPLEGRMALLKKAGFDITALWLGPEEEMVRSSRANEMAAIARSHGLAIDNVHAPYEDCNRLWSENGREREIVVREYCRCLDYCSAHDIPTVVVHVTKGDEVPAPNCFGLDAFESVMRISESTGIRLAIENTRHSAHIDYILENIDNPLVGLCYDVSHDFLYCPRPSALLNRRGHRLMAVHLSDNNGMSDCHWLPRKGMVDWDILQKNFPVSYDGNLLLEVFPKDASAEDEEVFLRKARETADWLERLLGAKK